MEVYVLLTILIYSIVVVLPWLIWQISSAIRLKKELRQTELQHLKSQVNPHFFFNTLNLLYGTIDNDSEKAKELVLKLSEMMRYGIYKGQDNQVTIEEEVEYLNQYLALQKLRFHRTIDVSFSTEIEDPKAAIMPLLFIILMENAFKHGVESLKESAFVKATINADQKRLTFALENNFDVEALAESGGIGLENLRRRLELGYPTKHTLTISTNQDIYRVALTLDLV